MIRRPDHPTSLTAWHWCHTCLADTRGTTDLPARRRHCANCATTTSLDNNGPTSARLHFQLPPPWSTKHA